MGGRGANSGVKTPQAILNREIKKSTKSLAAAEKELNAINSQLEKESFTVDRRSISEKSDEIMSTQMNEYQERILSTMKERAKGNTLAEIMLPRAADIQIPDGLYDKLMNESESFMNKEISKAIKNTASKRGLDSKNITEVKVGFDRRYTKKGNEKKVTELMEKQYATKSKINSHKNEISSYKWQLDNLK